MDKQFDFFAENEKNFYSKFDTDTVLIQGEHRKTEPLVTVLIPTYKRVDLLKEALESALNQKDFDDYQILVVDNEGVSVEEETETSIFMKNYDIEKVIYYRHLKSVSFKMDNAVKCARSKWIVFLHDDDVISSNHLKVMTSIAKKNPKAKFISCPLVEYTDGQKNEYTEYVGNYTYYVKKKNRNSICLGYYPGWLGALINREKYISTGGMPSISNLLGDFCMVQKFHYRYGIYEVVSDFPLYFHRMWKGQVSASGNEVWTKMLINEYNYFKYVNKKCHPFSYKFWNRLAAYRTLDKAFSMNVSDYRYNIEVCDLVTVTDMSDNSLYRNRQYMDDVSKMIIYQELCDKRFTIEKDRGEIC